MTDFTTQNKSGWVKVAFGECVEVVRENGVPTAQESKSYIGLEHMVSGELNIVSFGSDVSIKVPKTKIKKGDVLFARRNTHLRRCALAPFDTFFSPDGYAFRSSSNQIMQEYLLYLVASEGFMDFAVSRSAGTHSKRVKWSDLQSFEFMLPPLQEQARIVEVFQAFQVHENSLRDCDLRTKSLVLSLLNDTWVGTPERISLGHLIEDGPKNGLYRPVSDYGSGTRIVRIDTFDNGFLLDQTCWKRLRADQQEREEFSLREDDILINRVNSKEYVGQCALVPRLTEIAVFESNMMRLRLKLTDAIPSLIAAQINHPQARRQIARLRKDAVNQSSVNQADVKSLELPNLSMCKQKELAGALAHLYFVRVETLRRIEQSRRLSHLAAEQYLKAKTTDDI